MRKNVIQMLRIYITQIRRKMKRIFSVYFLTIMLSQNISGAQQLNDTPEEHQKLRNQIAFASICTEGINSKNEKLIADGSIDFNFPYGEFGRTQLSIAARSGSWPTTNGPTYNTDTIKWLLDHGANPNILDETGRSAALWCTGLYQGENEHPVALFFQQKNTININQIFTIKNIGDFYQSYQPKVTLLTAAVLSTFREENVCDNPAAWYNLVRTLLKFNPDRSLAPNGRTALQIAEDIGDEEMIKILKE